MNVCIKANELDLALDVYKQMLAEGCVPNLVTYNTLIDVYGKTGQWEEAVKVLDALEQQVSHPLQLWRYSSLIGDCSFNSGTAHTLTTLFMMLTGIHLPVKGVAIREGLFKETFLWAKVSVMRLAKATLWMFLETSICFSTSPQVCLSVSSI